MKCPYCNAELSAVYYSTSCPSCSKALHTCKACRFYDKNAPYGCKEHIDEPVTDKERANFCDFFSLTQSSPEDSRAAKEDAKAKFDSFFNI